MHVLKIRTFASSSGKGFQKWDRFRNLKWYHFCGSSDIYVQMSKDFKVGTVLENDRLMNACLEDSNLCIQFGKGFQKRDPFRNLKWYHFCGSSDIYVQMSKDFKGGIVLKNDRVMNVCLEDSNICIQFGKGFQKWDRFLTLKRYPVLGKASKSGTLLKFGSSDIYVQMSI